MTRLASIAMVLFLSITASAQIQRYDVTIPDTIDDTVDLGPLDLNGNMVSDNFFITNPTADTLTYTFDWTGYEVYIWLPKNENGVRIDTILPYATKREGFTAAGPMYQEPTAVAELNVYKLDGTLFATEHIHFISTETYAFDSTFTFDAHCFPYGVRANQWIYFGMNFLDPDNYYEPRILDSVRIVNASDSLVHIKTAYVLDSAEYAITGFSDPNFPVTLAKDEEFIIYLSYAKNAEEDPSLWNLLFVITDTTFQLKNAGYQNRPAKANPSSSVIETIESEKIVISPNPAHDRLLIHTKSAEITIHDAMGRMIVSFFSKDETSYDTRDLANGVYYCTIVKADLTEVHKFIISH